MKALSFFRAVLLGLALVAAGCAQYATVSTTRLTYEAVTPAGQIIARTLKHPAAPPLTRIGSYLDATSAATAVLAMHPADEQARRDYNFAVSRVFEVIHEAGLEPWNGPLSCPGAGRQWTLALKADPRPERNPALFRILPADRFHFRGTLVTERALKDGLGAPLVVTSKNFDPSAIDPFAQGKHLYYGMTGLVTFSQNRGTLSVADPLAQETIKFAGRSYPLAADFTAPLALAMAELKPRKIEIERTLRPENFASTTRLARLQPYDPKKIPVLCVHGLGDSQATWAPMIQSLRSDATIRKHYQFWFFSYPSGYPYPLMAAVLRRQLDAIDRRYPDHKDIVLIGHSMGGMISRTLLTDSGMNLWNAYYDKAPDQMPLSDETRQIMTESLIFKHRPNIDRVIFASASHRGADLATGFMGRLGATIISNSLNLGRDGQEIIGQAKPAFAGQQIKRMPNSVDFLDPGNRFVLGLDKLPMTKGVPYHSIIGDRGKGGNLNRTKPVSSDGIVPYWSSHLDGAASELIIPSGHWSHRHPAGIAEIRRILLQHLGRR